MNKVVSIDQLPVRTKQDQIGEYLYLVQKYNIRTLDKTLTACGATIGTYLDRHNLIKKRSIDASDAVYDIKYYSNRWCDEA